MKVLPSKMVAKPSSVSAAGDGLTAPRRRIAMRERTDFMVLSLGDGAAGNDEEIFAGGFWNRAAGGVMLCRFRVYTVCPSVTTAH